jgi:hypothetical protein
MTMMLCLGKTVGATTTAFFTLISSQDEADDENGNP